MQLVQETTSSSIKLPRTEPGGGTAGTGGVSAVSGGTSNDGAGLVAMVLRVQEESVFRTISEFL